MSVITERFTVLETEVSVTGEWFELNDKEFDFKVTMKSEHGNTTLNSDGLVDNHYAFRDALIKCLPSGATDNLRWVENVFLGKIQYLRFTKLIVNNHPAMAH